MFATHFHWIPQGCRIMFWFMQQQLHQLACCIILLITMGIFTFSAILHLAERETGGISHQQHFWLDWCIKSLSSSYTCWSSTALQIKQFCMGLMLHLPFSGPDLWIDSTTLKLIFSLIIINPDLKCGKPINISCQHKLKWELFWLKWVCKPCTLQRVSCIWKYILCGGSPLRFIHQNMKQWWMNN